MIQGTVEKIYENNVTTKFGPKMAYNLVIDGNKYSGGFDKPVCNEGDVIQFTSSQNGQYNNINKGSITVVQAAPAQAVTGGSTSKKSGNEFRSPDQIMRTSAIELVASMKSEVVPAMDLLEDAMIVFEYIKNGEESDVLAHMSMVETDVDPLAGE